MSSHLSPVEPSAALLRLQQLLFALLAQNGSNSFKTAAAIPSDVDLSKVGITSIDFLEFALSVEQEFGVSILDTIEPDALPQTLSDWQQLVSAQLAGRETSTS